MGLFFLSLLVVAGAVFLCLKLENKHLPKLKVLRFGRLMIAALFVAYVLWGLVVAWLLSNIFSNIGELVHPTQGKDIGLFNLLMAAGGLGRGAMTESLSLIFNLWALLGAAGLMVLRWNPWRWGRWPRVILGGMIGGLLLGRPVVGWLSWAGALLPQSGVFVALTYTLAPPLVMLLAGGWALQFAFEAVGWQALGIFSLCVALPVVLFNQMLQFDQALQVYNQQKAGLLGYITRFGFWLRGESPPDVPDESKGARFATSQEITEKSGGAQENPKAAIFGHIDGHPFPLYTDKHILIMASTRSGKGVSLIIPHLLRYEGSAFVLDPKGENARATGRRRAELNGKVHYLDPFGITGKPQARFNPLARFTSENMEAESKALAAALVMGERGVRDHWSASAQQLLASIILHVVTSPDIPPEQKDLPTVRRLVLKDLNKAFKDMLASDAADGLVSSLAASFVQTPERELGSIISTAQRETEILDNPSIIACLKAAGSGAALDFAEWHKGTMTAYLCLSAPKFPVFSRWLRLVLTSALDEMTDKLTPPALPVCFMLDELATLGHLAAVENAVGLAAGYGIQLVTVFQDVAQMKDLYKGRWASFIGNAGVRALFSLDDYDTAKYWSNFLGGHLVETRSQAQDIYGLTKSQTMGEALRPLLSPEEIMLHFAQGKMLVLPQGSRPIVSDRVAYFDDKGLEGLWDDPRGPITLRK